MASNDNNNHNYQVADSSEQELQGASEYAYGTFRGIGLQFKNLSIVMKAVGQQMQRRSESLKNAAPHELEFSMHTG